MALYQIILVVPVAKIVLDKFYGCLDDKLVMINGNVLLEVPVLLLNRDGIGLRCCVGLLTIAYNAARCDNELD